MGRGCEKIAIFLTFSQPCFAAVSGFKGLPGHAY